MSEFIFTKENVFCICLETAVDRTKDMKRKLEEIKLPFTIWKASTPDDVVDNMRSDMRPTEKACSQSHLNIYKHIVKNKIPYALILEDDACFDRRWRAKLDTFYKDIHDNKEWDAIFLNANGVRVVSPFYKWGKAFEQWLTGGYIISNKGAKIILNFKEYDVADLSTWNLQKLGNCYTYFPWLIIQENKNSTIGADSAYVYKNLCNILDKAEYPIYNYMM